jgi:hypothetical protein
MHLKKWLKKQKYKLIAILSSLIVIISYSLFVEPNLFVVTRHQLTQSALPTKTSFKLVQVTDLHLKQFNSRAEKIADEINQLKPNLLVFTGDIIDRSHKLKELNLFLSLIEREIPKYAVLGNWEHWSGVDLDGLSRLYQEHNCRLLVNQSILHRYGQQSILITGLDDFTGGKPDLAASLTGIAPSPNHLILAHSPGYRDSLSADEVAKLAQYKPQYMLSGHTHGGQIAFFGFAPLRPPGSGRYLSGWYKDPAFPTSLYVSRGLGVSSIPLRLGVVPEISYFEWFLRNS